MQNKSLQTFFLPDIFSQQDSTMRAENYNLAHTLLNRSDSDYIFIPIRNMQYLAIIDGDDFWFVDSQAYAVSGNEGGRLITVSWHTESKQERKALTENIPMNIIFYDQDMAHIQSRLCGELNKAMLLIDQRYRDQQIPSEGARIIKLKQDSNK